MGSRAALVVLAALASGCGAAKLVLKEPVSSQCASAGLTGCPELTDGVLAYVDGDKTTGEAKLRAAAKQNKPEQLKKFAEALEPVASGIGGDMGKELKVIVSFLVDANEGDAPAAVAKAGSASVKKPGAYGAIDAAPEAGASQRPAANLDLEALRTGLARPASDAKAAACEGGPFAGGGAACKRMRVFIGPLVVTNVYASGGCPDELFVSAGLPDRPHWLLSALPNATMNVAGAFVLEDGEELAIGARAAGASLKDDVRCTVVWSGFRPIDGAAAQALSTPPPAASLR